MYRGVILEACVFNFEEAVLSLEAHVFHVEVDFVVREEARAGNGARIVNMGAGRVD